MQENYDAYCAKITSTNNWDVDFRSDLRFYTSIGNNQNAEERLSILSNGNVGIGKDTPSEKLDVNGFVKGERFVCGDGSGSSALTVNDGDGNSNVTFNHTAGNPDQDGNAGRIVCNVDALTDANISFKVKSGVTAGSYIAAEQQMSIHEGYVKFTPGNVEIGRIDSNGLGLGVTLPSEKLDVDGNIKASGFVDVGEFIDLQPSAEPTGAPGRVYFSSATNKPRYYDGTQWNDLNSNTPTIDIETTAFDTGKRWDGEIVYGKRIPVADATAQTWLTTDADVIAHGITGMTRVITSSCNFKFGSLWQDLPLYEDNSGDVHIDYRVTSSSFVSRVDGPGTPSISGVTDFELYIEWIE